MEVNSTTNYVVKRKYSRLAVRLSRVLTARRYTMAIFHTRQAQSFARSDAVVVTVQKFTRERTCRRNQDRACESIDLFGDFARDTYTAQLTILASKLQLHELLIQEKGKTPAKAEYVQ
jgi:hypothetical protein